MGPLSTPALNTGYPFLPHTDIPIGHGIDAREGPPRKQSEYEYKKRGNNYLCIHGGVLYNVIQCSYMTGSCEGSIQVDVHPCRIITAQPHLLIIPASLLISFILRNSAMVKRICS